MSGVFPLHLIRGGRLFHLKPELASLESLGSQRVARIPLPSTKHGDNWLAFPQLGSGVGAAIQSSALMPALLFA